MPTIPTLNVSKHFVQDPRRFRGEGTGLRCFLVKVVEAVGSKQGGRRHIPHCRRRGVELSFRPTGSRSEYEGAVMFVVLIQSADY